jgi:outer membrane protein
MLPDLSFGYNLASNFANTFKKVNGFTFSGYQPIKGFEPIVDVNGILYPVQDPNVVITQTNRKFGELWQGWGRQLNNNFGQNFGFQVTVPIFNNGINRISYERSKLDLQTYELQKTQADLQLKQDIYNAHANATSSMKKFFVGIKNVESAQKAFDFATKRYELGLISTIDLLTTQNRLLTAKLQQVTNQLDYVFRMKLLEFYKGQGLIL